jgi:proteasome lid subunit RPN8/RPN11
MRVAVSGGNIFVAAKDAGVLIYHSGPPTQARPHEAGARAMPAYARPYAALSGRTIVCFLPRAGHLRIELFDLSGRLVARPYDGPAAQGTLALSPGRFAAGACVLRMRMNGCDYFEKMITAR